MADELYGILDSVTLVRDRNDFWRWRHTQNGIFTVKVAYQRYIVEAHAEPDISEVQSCSFKYLWNNFAPRRVPTIVWKALRQRLPTKDNLIRRGIHFDEGEKNCVLCDEQKEETTSHIFFECKAAFGIWSSIYKLLRMTMVMHNNPSLNFLQHSFLFESDKDRMFGNTLWICVVWTIWKARNEAIFRNTVPNFSSMIEEIKARLCSWVSVRAPEYIPGSFQDWLRCPCNRV